MELEKRIQVNGNWYVLEKQKSKNKVSFNPNDITYFNGAVFETNKYCYEADILTDNEGKFMFSVKFTRKGENREEEYWDNEDFLLGLIKGEEESILLLVESIPEDNEREIFIEFLKELNRKNFMEL